MSYDQTIKWAFIGSIAVLDILLLNCCNIELQWDDLLVPVACGALLAGLSIYYHQRGGDSLVLCMVALLHLGCYTTVIAVFIYEVTSFALPLNDHWMMSLDAAMGYSPKRLVDWMHAHPTLDRWSTWVYLFIVPETLLAVLAIAFAGKRRLLEQFTLQFMLGTFICGLFAWFLPAYGPLHGQGIVATDWQQPYLDHVLALRSGERYLFSWQQTEGLVTFPSFHTTWAIFLIFVWREQTRWLTIPLTFLNVAIVLSTLTTGEHYLLDVIGGIALAAICVAVSYRISAFAYDANGSPRIIDWQTVIGLTPVARGRSMDRC
jgi:membrane-associated phospholipid phosphatase